MNTHNDTFQEVLDRIDMETWLDSEGIDYRVTHGKSGLQLNIKECPVCGGNRWKVFLNAENGYGNCFSGSCEAKFNKWSFIKATSPGLSGGQIFELLKQHAQAAGWRAPRKTSAPVQNLAKLKLPESYAIPINGRNLRYLQDRHIDLGIAEYFKLSFSLKGKFWYQLDGNWRAQDYANRIIIPIYDLDGNLVSFQGRDITGQAEKKYLFPPGFASTGKYLYNGHNVANTRRVLVGEGVFDVMAAKIALDEDPEMRDIVPVGTFGKHLSAGMGDDQLGAFLQLKDRGVEEVTFMWDAEPKALADACHAAELLKGIGLKCRIAILPAGKDPNEVATEVVRLAYYKAIAATKSNIAKMLLFCRQKSVNLDL